MNFYHRYLQELQLNIFRWNYSVHNLTTIHCPYSYTYRSMHYQSILLITGLAVGLVSPGVFCQTINAPASLDNYRKSRNVDSKGKSTLDGTSTDWLMWLLDMIDPWNLAWTTWNGWFALYACNSKIVFLFFFLDK